MASINALTDPRPESGEDALSTALREGRTLTILKAKPEPDELDVKLLRPLSKSDPRFQHVSVWFQQIANKFRSDLMEKSIHVSAANGASSFFRDTDNISSCFHEIQAQLFTSAPGLQVCIVSANSEQALKMYSFPYQIRLLWTRKYDQAGRVVHLVLAALLGESWASNWLEREMIKLLLLQPSIPTKMWNADLPSLRVDSEIKPLPPERLIRPPLEVGAYNWHDCFYLEWQWSSNVKAFDSDIDVYVWQPYKDQPTFDWVRIVVLPDTNREHRRVLVTASSSSLYTRVKDTHVFPDGKNPTLPGGVNGQLVQVFRNL